MIKNVITSMAISLLCFGCVSMESAKNSAQPGAPLPERYSLPPVQKELVAPAEGTIFSQKSKNLYQDTRARNIGDIVMVKIVETSSGKKKAETTTSRESGLSGGVSSLFGYENKIFGGTGNHVPSSTSLSAILSKDFTGTGETERDSTVTATLSARIVDITMDGNLMVRGYREIRVNNETQHIILSGVVRPEDISPDNSVLSSYIADARIEYNGSGVISNKQQPGWLANLLDVAWPF